MMKLFACLILLGATCLTLACPPPTADNVFGTGVTYQGIHLNEVEAFLDIRYANDTSGANRFKPPVPYTPAPQRTVLATAPGPACPQAIDKTPINPFNLSSHVTHISEDCLKLNVWRPNGTKAGDSLPVLVFIHGGSLVQGHKDAELYQPGGLLLQSVAIGHPIIHVELNYRLGIFGFAQGAALAQQGSLNAGVRDQRMALEWVQSNIAAFGGDPSKITIHGQSSGGLSVGLQLLAYGGQKAVPFHQLIAESEILDLAITSNVTRTVMTATAKNATCSSNIDTSEAIQCLRDLPLQTKYPASNAGDWWLPTIDGDFLPAAPSTLVRQGRYAKGIRSIIGWTEDELRPFVMPTLSTPNDTYGFVRSYVPGLSEEHVQQLLDLYPSSDFQPSHLPNGTVEFDREGNRGSRIFRDLLFTCQSIFFGQQFHNAGNVVYFYLQNQTLLGPAFAAKHLYDVGIPHTSELIYVYGNVSKYDIPGFAYNPSASDYRLQGQESGSWASFAATGDPSPNNTHDGTLQAWAPADFQDPNYGVFVIGGPYEGSAGKGGNSMAQQAVAAQRLKQRCDFLNSPAVIEELEY